MNRSVQQVFDLMLTSGRYQKSKFMCNAISVAEEIGLITRSELDAAEAEINQFLAEEAVDDDYVPITLVEAIIQDKFKLSSIKGMPYTSRIYADWKNRHQIINQIRKELTDEQR